MNSENVVRAYYEAFNAGDFDAMVALLTEDVVHDINQSRREVGREAFAAFMAGMERSYSERLTEIVVMTEPTGTRAAAEFIVHGTYLAADDGMPTAHGQSYVLPAGAFLALRDGLICRVTNYYNLADWLAQVSVAAR